MKNSNYYYPPGHPFHLSVEALSTGGGPVNFFMGGTYHSNYTSPPYTEGHTSSAINYTPTPSYYISTSKKVAPKLHQAVERDDLREISRLVNSGVNVNTIDENQETALHYAAKYKRIESINQLIDLGINTEIKNIDNKTARDLLQQHLPIQSEFDNVVIKKHKYNIKIMNTVLSNILDFIPGDLVNIISEYNGSLGPLLKLPKDIGIEEKSSNISSTKPAKTEFISISITQIESSANSSVTLSKLLALML